VDPKPRATRRRGRELEDAILEAAWDQLSEAGYAGFGYEPIAERARTSKPVLYRRWPTRRELLLATFRHHGERTRLPIPDTGSLREDVLTLLRRSSANRGREFTAITAASLGAAYEQDAPSPAELRRALIGDQPTAMERLVARAIERGEIDAAAVTPRVATVAFDLYRNEAILTLAPVPDATLVEIVDEVFLPLLRARAVSEAGRPRV